MNAYDNLKRLDPDIMTDFGAVLTRYHKTFAIMHYNKGQIFLMEYGTIRYPS